MAIDYSKKQKLSNPVDHESEMLDDIETPRVLNRTTTYQGRLVRNSSQDLRQADQPNSARNSGQS